MMYFDKDLKQVFLGVDLNSPEEAYYSTANPNDPVFAEIPPGTIKKVFEVNGRKEVRIVSRPPTREMLYARITQMKYEKIELGFFVTGPVMRDGVVTENVRVSVPVDRRLKVDINALVTSYHILNKTRPTPLKVDSENHLIVKTKEDISTLFKLGEELIEKSYIVASECLTLLKNTSDADLGTLDSLVTEEFFKMQVEGTL